MNIKKLKNCMLLCMLVCFLLFDNVMVHAEGKNTYERYFQFKKFNSENGLDGTSVNCILPSKDGFLWIGGYSGLQRYDGTEFKKFLLNGKTLPINDIEQDEDGHFWIATNGEGLFHYDCNEFRPVQLGQVGEGAYTVNKIFIDASNKVWIGTKEGLFVYNRKITSIETLSSKDIISITEVDKGKIVVIEKAGNVYLIENNAAKEIIIPEREKTGKPRCCARGTNGDFFVGTAKEQILKLDSTGKVEIIIENPELKCINSISEIDKGAYLVCTDTGIGMLKEDALIKLGIPLTDSVEEVCMDYEGNFWFASSRQGILQVFKNLFSDLGTYLGIDKTVNSVVMHQEHLYIGCDDGVYCYRNKDLVNNELTEICKGERIRQIYKDREGQLWVSTYYSGLKILDTEGKILEINKQNSELKTNQIRCTYQRQNGDMLVGTEQGVFLINQEKQVRHLVENHDFNSMRVLDVREAPNGKIYATTDGHGVYVIKDDYIENIYTKQQGILSNIVMKVVPSKQLNGVWFISGIGINFLSESGKITEIGDIGMSNVLSMDLLRNGEAVIYAANGLFRIQEKDLLHGCYDSLVHYKRHDGLPVDFTANSWNSIENNVLYMCGTKGVACTNLNRKLEHKELKIYIHDLLMDGNRLEKREGRYILPSDGYRLTIDVRCINYIYKDYDISYYMEGIDQNETIIEHGKQSEISYTNLKGGDYKYHFKLLSPENGECLAKIVIPMHKVERIIERPEVQVLVMIFAGLLFGAFVVLLIRIKEKRINKMLAVKYQEEKDRMMERLAYRDMVTGVYNRNLFEEDKKKVDIAQITAIVLFSVNHIRYIEQKLGVLHTGEILRHAVEVATNCQNKNPKVYRLSENVFCLVFSEAIELDQYIMSIKSAFALEGEERNLKLSLAVGGIYNNRIRNETIDGLISRCEKIRLLDEKKAEAEFVEGQIKILS